MQLNHLKYLQAIEKYGSMNKAAKELFVTQPTLSKAIQTMEKEVGGSLIRRSGNGIELTDLGKVVYQDSKIIIGYLKNWKLIASNESSTTPVTICLTGSVPRYNFINAIIDTKKNNPNLDIRVRSVETDKNRIPVLSTPPRIMVQYFIPDHIASALEYANSHNMNMAIIHKDNFQVFANAKNPLMQKDTLELADLRDSEVIMFQDPKFFPYKSYLDEINCTMGVQMWQEETLMVSLTLDEEAISFRPGQIAVNSPYIDNGSLKTKSISDCPMPIYLCIFYPPEDRLTSSESTVMTALKQYFPEFRDIDKAYLKELLTN